MVIDLCVAARNTDGEDERRAESKSSAMRFSNWKRQWDEDRTDGVDSLYSVGTVRKADCATRETEASRHQMTDGSDDSAVEAERRLSFGSAPLALPKPRNPAQVALYVTASPHGKVLRAAAPGPPRRRRPWAGHRPGHWAERGPELGSRREISPALVIAP
eukprot:scaffold2975_cov248-Pinguiococcus_pyrenoidosus.AAC.4